MYCDGEASGDGGGGGGGGFAEAEREALLRGSYSPGAVFDDNIMRVRAPRGQQFAARRARARSCRRFARRGAAGSAG
jgi:hypothetical protein